MAKRPSDPPPVSQNEIDDRTMAINWYVRRLLIQQKELGVSQAEMSRKSGMTTAQLSHIINDARSAGFKAVLRLARTVFRMSEGELVDASLKHWEERGRREWAEEKMRAAEAAKRQVEEATRRKPSGERPSVKLRAGLVAEPPPVPAPNAKKK